MKMFLTDTKIQTADACEKELKVQIENSFYPSTTLVFLLSGEVFAGSPVV